MNIDMLRTFLAVADAGSIHAAARLLHIGQPSVSKTIKQLERALKTELFVRSPQGIQLTRSGAELLEHAREVVARIDAMPDLMQRKPTDPVTVTLGFIVGSDSMSTLVEGVFGEILNSSRHIELIVRELNFCEQFSAIEQGEVDLAIVNPPYLGDELKVEKLFAEPMHLWLREDHPLSGHSHIPVEAVVQYPMVDMQGVPEYWSRFWRLSDVGPSMTHNKKWPVRTLRELRYAILATGATMPVALGALSELHTPNLTSIGLNDAPLSEVGIALYRTESRPEVLEVIEKARLAARRILHRIQGGVDLSE